WTGAAPVETADGASRFAPLCPLGSARRSHRGLEIAARAALRSAIPHPSPRFPHRPQARRRGGEPLLSFGSAISRPGGSEEPIRVRSREDLRWGGIDFGV